MPYTPTYYKILSCGHNACHGGDFTYATPHGKRPGKWTPRINRTSLCKTGYHVATIDQLSRWLFGNIESDLPLELWECETDGLTAASDKSVCSRIRLTRLVGTLDALDLRWLGTIFAERVLGNTDDPRVGECINAVRAYSLGFLDDAGLRAAEGAAEGAAESAARSAAWSAAEGAAEGAAESAARSAAWSAAEGAAEGAAESAARSAAWSAAEGAAEGAAESAARSAAWSAAEGAARSAQGQDILDYLEA